jgi:formamidopyrimidine-DNA glycosylase
MRQHLVRKTFLEVRRLGKRLVFQLSDGSNLVIEPRMTGLVLLADPPDVEHLRIKWHFDGPGKYNIAEVWESFGYLKPEICRFILERTKSVPTRWK